jgi:ribosome-associated protein
MFIFRERVIRIESNKKAQVVAQAASDKKAKDIVTIDMRKVPNISDYFVVSSGTSTTQVRAIADHITEKMKEVGEKLYHSEGERDALWVLLDFGSVVAHIFFEDTRRFYSLERLWGDVPQKKFKEPKPRKAPKKAAKRPVASSRVRSKARKAPKKASRRR